MHTNNLDEYRSFLKTIKEPLIRLDHVEVKKLETLGELEMLELNFRDSKDEDKFTEISKDFFELINWCEEEITSLSENYPIKIEERKQASWQGHQRLPFPVVWNRETYNKVEPEVRTLGKKKEWLDWIIGNIEEGSGNYWSYNSQICNSTLLDWRYYVDEKELLDDPDDLFEETSFITAEFVDFLLTAKKIWSMKTGKEVFKLHEETPETKDTLFSDTHINNLSMRTIQAHFDQGLSLSWSKIRHALKDYTNNHERIEQTDLNRGDEAKLGLRMFFKDEVVDELLISTFKKNLSNMRKILKQGGKLPLLG